MHDLGSLVSQAIKRQTHVDDLKAVVVVIDDQPAGPDNGFCQFPVIQHRRAAVIGIDKDDITGRQIIGRQIESAAVTQKQLEPLVTDRKLARDRRNLPCLNLAGETVTGPDIDSDVALDTIDVAKNGGGSPAAVAPELHDGASLGASDEIDQNVELARMNVSARQPIQIRLRRFDDDGRSLRGRIVQGGIWLAQCQCSFCMRGGD